MIVVDDADVCQKCGAYWAGFYCVNGHPREIRAESVAVLQQLRDELAFFKGARLHRDIWESFDTCCCVASELGSLKAVDTFQASEQELFPKFDGVRLSDDYKAGMLAGAATMMLVCFSLFPLVDKRVVLTETKGDVTCLKN